MHQTIKDNVAQRAPKGAKPNGETGGFGRLRKPMQLVDRDFLIVPIEDRTTDRRGHQCHEEGDHHGAQYGMGRAMKDVGVLHHANEGLDIHGDLSDTKRDETEMLLCCGLDDKRRTHMKRGKWHGQLTVQRVVEGYNTVQVTGPYI